MKGWLCTLLLLESFVFVVQQQVDGGLAENEISQQLSNEDRRQNPPQTDSLRDEASTDSQQYCHLSFPDIHAALRELTATVTEQKANIRVLETQLREELNKKTDGRPVTASRPDRNRSHQPCVDIPHSHMPLLQCAAPAGGGWST
ncbi:uncharacterized protein LOC131538154 isoform X3 [Onychostoma macrolepis]|uniref:uncharacterized protein LOC131538154 isoform X3 n=1 Tax=Onychostoma macrolepis TaxID=369639 RepID=UPI00272AED61|nr:uncharacterized protein LOC131538154 isoform X3 [Onychostoma macrolepis]